MKPVLRADGDNPFFVRALTQTRGRSVGRLGEFAALAPPPIRREVRACVYVYARIHTRQ